MKIQKYELQNYNKFYIIKWAYTFNDIKLQPDEIIFSISKDKVHFLTLKDILFSEIMADYSEYLQISFIK